MDASRAHGPYESIYRFDRWRSLTPAVTRIKRPSSNSAESCKVGMFVGVGGGPTAPTAMLAEAVPPVPPSAEVTAPVTLIFVPDVAPVTLTLNVHDALPASDAPLKLTLPDPAVAAIVPPPQVPARPFGVETTRPAGNVSLKPIPVSVDAFGLVSVKPSEVVPPTTMLPAPNAFAIVGGAAAATTTLADAVRPVPPWTEVTAPVTLFLVPTVVPVTLTLNVQDALDASDAPARVTVLDPAVAVIVPPPQLPVSPLGVETTRPAGSVSVTPTPVNVDALGLVIVRLSEVDPFNGTVPAPKRPAK
jgi:hypothetical protein